MSQLLKTVSGERVEAAIFETEYSEDTTHSEPMATILRICPAIECVLDSGMGLGCPVEGCDRVVTKHSTMASHLKTHLPEGTVDSTSTRVKYHCPSKECSYSLENGDGSTFKAMSFLRQHYMKVHATKRFVCGGCGKSFGTKTFLNIHARMCGILFQCSCGKSFSSLASLQTHGRRSSHPFELHKYRKAITDRKNQELENVDTVKVKIMEIMETQEGESVLPPPSEKAKSKISPSVRRTTCITIPILPKPTMDDDISRVLILKKPCLSIDIGTQTTPLLVRKRSTTRHSQTEFKSTKTTGTLTVAPTTPVVKQFAVLKRKASAQTQTKKLKISTETQTPVVTKRKRCMRKKQITTATTQTPIRVLQPLQQISFSLENQTTVSTESQPASPPLVSNMFESFDEVHCETQTDPNPFFGYPSSAHPAHLDVFLSEESDLGEEDDGGSGLSSKLKTIETQTSPTRKMSSERSRNQPNFQLEPLKDGNYFSCARGVSSSNGDEFNSLALQTPSIGEDTLGSYLETMDSETQTTFFDSATFSSFIY